MTLKKEEFIQQFVLNVVLSGIYKASTISPARIAEKEWERMEKILQPEEAVACAGPVLLSGLYLHMGGDSYISLSRTPHSRLPLIGYSRGGAPGVWEVVHSLATITSEERSQIRRMSRILGIAP